MKRALIHFVAASLFWTVTFGFLFRAEERTRLSAAFTPGPIADEQTWRDQPELIDGTDVRFYERIQLSNGIGSGGNPTENKALLTRFLWLHWTTHTPALAEVTYSGVDAGATHYYFVEKDSEDGQWTIRRALQGWGLSTLYPMEHLPTVYFVERFSLNVDGSIGGPLDSQTSIGASDFTLRFFDRNHNSIDTTFF
jgi:hypothetical protein